MVVLGRDAVRSGLDAVGVVRLVPDVEANCAGRASKPAWGGDRLLHHAIDGTGERPVKVWEALLIFGLVLDIPRTRFWRHLSLGSLMLIWPFIW